MNNILSIKPETIERIKTLSLTEINALRSLIYLITYEDVLEPYKSLLKARETQLLTELQHSTNPEMKQMIKHYLNSKYGKEGVREE